MFKLRPLGCASSAPRDVATSSFATSYPKGWFFFQGKSLRVGIHENPSKFKIIQVRPPEKLCRPEIRLTVDTPEDIVVTRKIYEAFEGKMPLSIASIIGFLDEHPEISAINEHIDAGMGRIIS